MLFPKRMHYRLVWICAIFIAILYETEAAVQPFITLSELLWTPQEIGEISAYRIPAATRCPNDGSLLAFSEARKYNSGDAGPKFLAFRKSKNGGQSWTETRYIVDDWSHPGGLSLGAVIVDEEINEIIVLYTSCAHLDCTDRNTTARQFQLRSNDCGDTWSKSIDLADANPKLFNWTWVAGPGYGVQKKIEPHKGRLVVCGHTIKGPMGLYCIYSDDHGYTWRKGAKIPSIPFGGPVHPGDFAPTENQVVELKDGTLFFDARNEYKCHCACRMSFNSTDGAESIPLTSVQFNPTAVDPTCAGSILLHNDIMYMSQASNTKSRVNTTLRWSMDYGQSWPYSLNINPGASGYSVLTNIDDNHIGVIYERGLGPLWFVKFQLNL